MEINNGIITWIMYNNLAVWVILFSETILTMLVEVIVGIMWCICVELFRNRPSGSEGAFVKLG